MDLYFNPRTREGCDSDDGDTLNSVGHISIHAPVKGATLLHRLAGPCDENFNPRTREGCDTIHSAKKGSIF